MFRKNKILDVGLIHFARIFLKDRVKEIHFDPPHSYYGNLINYKKKKKRLIEKYIYYYVALNN